MFRSLRYHGCRAEGRAQARAGGRQPFSIYTDRRLAAMRGMRAPMVVKDNSVADPLAGLSPAREGMQIDALVFYRTPQPLDKSASLADPPKKTAKDFREKFWYPKRCAVRDGLVNGSNHSGIARWVTP